MSPDTVLADNGIARITRADYDLELTRLPPSSPRRLRDEREARRRPDQPPARDPDARHPGGPGAPARGARNGAPRGRRDGAAQGAAHAGEDGARRRSRLRREPRPASRRARASSSPWTPRKYGTPAEVSASHILFVVPPHPLDEAKRLAEAARAEILAGADFAKLAARAVGGSRPRRTTEGQLGFFKRGQSEAAFEQAAFALDQGRRALARRWSPRSAST